MIMAKVQQIVRLGPTRGWPWSAEDDSQADSLRRKQRQDRQRLLPGRWRQITECCLHCAGSLSIVLLRRPWLSCCGIVCQRRLLVHKTRSNARSCWNKNHFLNTSNWIACGNKQSVAKIPLKLTKLDLLRTLRCSSIQQSSSCQSYHLVLYVDIADWTL